MTAAVTTTQQESARVPFASCWIAPDARRAALRVLTSGWVTTGSECRAFEDEFAEHVGAEHAVSVASCTAAIELGLRSLRLPPGSAVLTSTLTFCGAVQAILHAGLRPVLVDVDPRTGMPTVETTRQAARGCDDPQAMVVIHWAGDPADVAALADAAGLPVDRVVEDAAHALGADLSGTPVGTGATVCFSFYATKNLPIGEGGMLTTSDPERAEWIRRARLHGMSADAWRRYLPGGSWRYDVPDAGLKANLTDLQAAIGRAQLRHLDHWQQERGRIAQQYDERLGRLRAVRLPHRPSAGTHAWHLYPIQVQPWAPVQRDELVAFLDERGVGTSVHFIPVHTLTYFKSVLEVPPGGFPGADELFTRLVSLPMHPRLTDAQVDAVCDAVVACETSTPATPIAPVPSNQRRIR
ncbi:MAG: DegT/DnrJ/EryC1/StrS family aminotransferase [Nocardioidaceae bacterium]